MFTSWHNTGFQIILPNHITVSVQFGPGNYCDNRDTETTWNNPSGIYKCANAEVAIIDSLNGYWLTNQCWKEVFNEELTDDVVGFITSEQLIPILNWASTYSH